MRWKVAEAKQRLSEVIRSAANEPQLIYNRGRLVAAVVDPKTLQAFESWQQKKKGISVADAFAELRRVAAEEGYELELPTRQDRPNPLTETLDELSGGH